jgi:uncharacterized protein YbjT (DUF2867 family)
MIAVMGATGHTGRRIAERLLAAGERVRALGRSASKIAELGVAGADTAVGDAADVQFLASAFRGADAVFTLIPPDPRAADYRATQDAVGAAIVEAVQAGGIRHVVFLSSLGAELPAGTGPIAGLNRQERRLRALTGVNTIAFRAGYFFENFYTTLGLIKHQGVNGGAMAPDLRMPMIATSDIADAAVEVLVRRDWSGMTMRELLGPRDLSHQEATSIIGSRIGRPDLRYVQFPYAEFAASLVQAGLSQSVAGLYAELADAMNDGRIRSLEGRHGGNTTPTRFEDFVNDLAGAYAEV